MKSCLGITAALIAAAVMAACSGRGGPAVANVDGRAIRTDDLKHEMLMERLMYDPAVLTTETNLEAFRRQSLDRLIQEEIMLGEAKRLGISAKGELPEGIAAMASVVEAHGINTARWLEAQKRRVIIKELIEREVVDSIEVSDEDVKAYYKKNTKDFRENTAYHARQILVETREEAEMIRARLAGGADFAELAEKHSQSPDRARGGDLGYFDSESYPEIFTEICRKLSPDEISKVTATPYGYQIFQLIDSRQARLRPIEEVAEEIRRRIREERVDEVYLPWVASLMERADVRIDEEALREVRIDG